MPDPAVLSLEDLTRRLAEVEALNERSPSSMGAELVKAYGDAIHYAQEAGNAKAWQEVADRSLVLVADAQAERDAAVARASADRELLDRVRAVLDEGHHDSTSMLSAIRRVLTPTEEGADGRGSAS